jgi:hypothetical protein
MTFKFSKHSKYDSDDTCFRCCKDSRIRSPLFEIDDLLNSLSTSENRSRRGNVVVMKKQAAFLQNFRTFISRCF